MYPAPRHGHDPETTRPARLSRSMLRAAKKSTSLVQTGLAQQLAIVRPVIRCDRCDRRLGSPHQSANLIPLVEPALEAEEPGPTAPHRRFCAASRDLSARPAGGRWRRLGQGAIRVHGALWGAVRVGQGVVSTDDLVAERRPRLVELVDSDREDDLALADGCLQETLDVDAGVGELATDLGRLTGLVRNLDL